MSQDSILAPVVYKDVADFPGYRVGTDGTAWTCLVFVAIGQPYAIGETWHKMKPGKRPNGYLNITMLRAGRRRCRSLHVLILETFVGPCPPGHECAHDNGKRDDCRLSNLAWKTKKANHADKRRHGTQQTGERNGNSKLIGSQVLQMRALRFAGATQAWLADYFEVSKDLVGKIDRREMWKDV